MKICLIYPPQVSANLYEEWDLSDVDSLSPPLGVLLLAAILRREGHEVSFIDAYSNGLSVVDTASRALAGQPDAVGITATTPVAMGAGAVAEIIKSRSPEVVTVIGGPHVTAVPEETLNTLTGFDLAVLGEGDLTIVELFQVLEEAGVEELDHVRGIAFRRDGEIHRTPPRPFLEDLDWLPYPAWDMLPSLTDPYRVSVSSMNKGKSTAIITSRGCPGQCSFCDTRVFGQKIRAHSAEYVLGMMSHLTETYGITEFSFYDDNFTTFRKRLRVICEELAARKGISWSCNARVNLVTRELLEMMRNAGCWQIEYGIETGSPEVLALMNKKISLEQVRRALAWTTELGMYTKGNFIFGYMGETRESMRETLDFLLSIDLDYFQQTFFTPYPGSAACRVIEDYGTVDFDWTRLNNNSINFVPDGLTEKDLVEFSKTAFRRFYLRPKVMLRHALRVRNLEMFKRYFAAFVAFVKTVTRKS